MSGPPYPHPNPSPGSNGIGSFAIGISPIGDISTFDFWTTVLSQYANSPTLTGIIESFNDAMDQTVNIENFFDLIWNVLTAQGYGLDVWGRIVGVSRTLRLPAGVTQYLGPEEAAGSWTGFNQGGFFTGGAVTSNYVLSDAEYRPVVLAKAAANVCDGSIQSVNSILLGLFPGRGACYVADGLNMSVTYTFAFPLSAVDLAIIENSGVIPTATGVVATISQL